MTKRTSKTRRRFLKNTLIGGGATIVAAASGAAIATPQARRAEAKPARESRGYQATSHVQTYYKTAQF